VISAVELSMLLRHVENVEALHNLLRDGLVRPVLHGDSIVAITTTTAGGAKLRSVTLPTADA
jgi:hypothetical protein